MMGVLQGVMLPRLVDSERLNYLRIRPEKLASISH